MLEMNNRLNTKVVAEKHEHWEPFVQSFQDGIPTLFNAASRLQHFEASDLFLILFRNVGEVLREPAAQATRHIATDDAVVSPRRGKRSELSAWCFVRGGIFSGGSSVLVHVRR